MGIPGQFSAEGFDACFHNGVEEPLLNIIEFYCHKPKILYGSHDLPFPEG